MRPYGTFFAGVCFLFCSFARANDATLEIGFNNKPPFFFWENHQPKGILVEMARKALDRSGVAYRFEEIPALRNMAYLKLSKPNFAVLGLNKTPAREEFVVFSEPIFRGSTAELLIRAGESNRYNAYKSIDALIDSGKFTFGGKEGNAYPIDSQLKRLAKNDLRFQVETPMLAKLLVAKRFDFTVIFPEELEYALQASKVEPSAIEVFHYPDIPQSKRRYLLFTKSTNPEVIGKINKAISEVIAPVK